MSYAKLFSSILDSSIWELPPPVKVVWITMLAMADQYGEVHASVPGLAKRAGVDRETCEQALTVFSSPDKDSRSQEEDGKRLMVIDGGWRLVNHEKYRRRSSIEEIREKAAARQARFRERNASVTTRNVTVTEVTRSNGSNDIRSDHLTSEQIKTTKTPPTPIDRQGEADAADPSTAPTHQPRPEDAWRFEQSQNWATLLRPILGSKLGPKNWQAWKRLASKFPIDDLIEAAESLEPTKRWPDEVETFALEMAPKCTAAQAYDPLKTPEHIAACAMIDRIGWQAAVTILGFLPGKINSDEALRRVLAGNIPGCVELMGKGL